MHGSKGVQAPVGDLLSGAWFFEAHCCLFNEVKAGA